MQDNIRLIVHLDPAQANPNPALRLSAHLDPHPLAANPEHLLKPQIAEPIQRINHLQLPNGQLLGPPVLELAAGVGEGGQVDLQAGQRQGQAGQRHRELVALGLAGLGRVLRWGVQGVQRVQGVGLDVLLEGLLPAGEVLA
jgi:hypothetical protein